MDPWRELEEAEEIEDDFFRALMEEPPGGANHGYVKGEGEYLPLAIPHTPDERMLSGPKLAPPRHHGTAYTYQKIKCRCELCRAWKRQSMREYRARRNPK